MTEAVILGRQPAKLWITPSAPNAWYSMEPICGDELTAEQKLGLASMGLAADSVEVITVKRNATDREMYWGVGQCPPQYHFPCPVVGRRRDGKIDVISPSGMRKLVGHDGWVGKPGRPRLPLW